MDNYTFHWEVKDLVLQFMRSLDGCVIKRYDENNTVQSEISPRYIYAPKSRILNWMVNKEQNITLPVVACSISSIQRDSSRVFNKIDGPMYIDTVLQSPLQPLPIDISVDVSLLAKYQNDMDQMVQNFAAYFDPYIILSWKHPTIDREIRSEVLWGGNLAFNYPTDIAATQQYRFGVDTSFIIKGWMFKKAATDTSIIYTVRENFYGVSNIEQFTDFDYCDSLNYTAD